MKILSQQIEGEIELPTLRDSSEMALLNINRIEFVRQQKDCPEITTLYSRVSEGIVDSETKHLLIVNEVLVREQEDRMGDTKKLLVVPKSLRPQVMTLCHEGTSAHLGSTKSKDKLTRNFFFGQTVLKTWKGMLDLVTPVREWKTLKIK